MRGKLEEELDQLTDEEIEKRLAAAVWVDDKRAAVPRYLEHKKPGRKKEAQAGELEIVRSAKDAAWAAVDVAKEANWSCFPSLHPFPFGVFSGPQRGTCLVLIVVCGVAAHFTSVNSRDHGNP
jgi:hypothetical protein